MKAFCVVIFLFQILYPNSNSIGPGSHLGLYVVLNANVSDYFCSSTESAGFKILLHNPTETPRISDYGLLVSTGRETRVVVTPKISTASYLVKKVPSLSRRCYFPNERKLDFFRYDIKFSMFCLNFNLKQILTVSSTYTRKVGQISNEIFFYNIYVSMKLIFAFMIEL